LTWTGPTLPTGHGEGRIQARDRAGRCRWPARTRRGRHRV